MRREEIAEQIAHCLHKTGMPFLERAGALRFDREREGLRWACGFTFQDDYAHLFGRLPFMVDAGGALPTLNRLNASLAEGCFFLQDDFVLLRQTLFVPDAFAAKPALDAALPRQASFMIRARDALARLAIANAAVGRIDS